MINHQTIAFAIYDWLKDLGYPVYSRYPDTSYSYYENRYWIACKNNISREMIHLYILPDRMWIGSLIRRLDLNYEDPELFKKIKAFIDRNYQDD